jgi:hypothetical protein
VKAVFLLLCLLCLLCTGQSVHGQEHAVRLDRIEGEYKSLTDLKPVLVNDTDQSIYLLPGDCGQAQLWLHYMNKNWMQGIGAVRDLVAGFFRVNFFSLQDRYTSKKLPDGNSQTVDHANATTISIDIDGKKKSVYIFYGAPDELIDLQRRLYEVTQIAQYVGRA